MTGEHFHKLVKILQHCAGNTRNYPTPPPNEGRNYIYAAGSDIPLCLELADMGLMSHGQTDDVGQYFYATPLGLEIGRMPPCRCDYLHLFEE